jgi:hypothetical protein
MFAIKSNPAVISEQGSAMVTTSTELFRQFLHQAAGRAGQLAEARTSASLDAKIGWQYGFYNPWLT